MSFSKYNQGNKLFGDLFKSDISVKAVGLSVEQYLYLNKIKYQYTIMFNKAYGVDFQYPTIFWQNGQLWNSHFCFEFF